MTASTPKTKPAARPPGHQRRGWVVVALIVVLIAVLAIGLLYLNRRAAARQVLVGWLDDRGILADVEVERIELDGFTARIRVGDPDDPDVTVDRVEVDYVIAPPWRPGGVQPRAIRLVRPVVRATWANGKLSLGSLDPLIEEFSGRPPQPDQRGPVIEVTDGRLRLTSEYGPVEARGSARIEDGRLMRLQAVMPAADLRSGDAEALGLQGAVDMTTVGDRIRLGLSFTAASLAGPSGVRAEEARVRLGGDLPYPDLQARRGDGRAVILGRLGAGRATSAGFDGQGVSADLAFDGNTTGWIEAFDISGAGRLTVEADRLAGAVSGRAVRIEVPRGDLSLARSEDMEWRFDGPATLTGAEIGAGEAVVSNATLRSGDLTLGGRGAVFEAEAPLALEAGRFSFGDLALERVRGALDLDLVQSGVARMRLEGAVSSGGGRWPLLGASAQDDLPEMAAMKAALGDFRLVNAPFRFNMSASGVAAVLTGPATIAPGNGGQLTLTPVSTPVFEAVGGAAGGGAVRIDARRGAGLPEAGVDVTRWALTPGGFTADLRGQAALDFGLARGLRLTTAGRLASDGGRLTFAAGECSPFTVETLDLGENDVFDVSGRLCPSDRPLATVLEGGWRADGRFEAIAARAPFLDMAFSGAEGVLAVQGGPGALAMQTTVTSASVTDTAEARRFNPLGAAGRAELARETWTGAFDLTRNGQPLARVSLNHDGRVESGGLTVEAPELVFSPGELQPADVSPLLADWMKSPVTGSAGFTGRMDWTPDTATSSGVLETPGLSFLSPAGQVQGLAGRVELTSLAPPVTAPNQTVRIASVDAVVPLENLEVTFGLGAESMRFEGATVDLAGGRVTLEPLDLPLDMSKPFNGVLVLDRVQLGDLIAGTGFADKISMDAVVSGRLPFTSDPEQGIRITGGTIHAVQPGRLSIRREALVGLETGGGGEAVPPNTVQDLAYQAMENLSFDILSAEVNSLDEGRLGVLFHIKGRHDPPERQVLRLTLQELISRQFLNRSLPLPSGTEIDLTLDTTLNANQLISDMLEIQRIRQGQAEQQAVTSEP